MTNALVEAAKSPDMLTAAEIRARVNRIQEIMQAVMKKDVHFGIIPGTDKPTLYKPGAEKILATFRIAAQNVIEDLSTPDEVRYRVTVRGVNQITGEVLGEGSGECSSSEEKYKWRRPVHENEYAAMPEDRRREKYQRNGDVWKQVRTEPADVANTVLKMAVKRALVAMTLVVTAASDVFSQDIEDLPEELREAIGDEPHAEAPNVRRSQQANGSAPLPDGVVRLVGKVEERKGKGKNNKEYTKFTVTDSRGTKYSTFSETLADTARKCIGSRAPVQLVYEETQYGNDLKEIKLWEAPAQPPTDLPAQPPPVENAATTSREPGEEG